MKTAIIILLLGVILGLAYLTRPSQRSFETALNQQLQDRAATASATLLPGPIDTESLLKDVVYKDRYLWVDVQKDGKTVYTGAFGHWFEWGKIVEAPAERTTIKLPV
jgi:hypothetical protein